MRLLPCDEINEKPNIISGSSIRLGSAIDLKQRNIDKVDIDLYYQAVEKLHVEMSVGVRMPTGYETKGVIKSVIRNGLPKDCRFNVLTNHGVRITVSADINNTSQPRLLI